VLENRSSISLLPGPLSGTQNAQKTALTANIVRLTDIVDFSEKYLQMFFVHLQVVLELIHRGSCLFAVSSKCLEESSPFLLQQPFLLRNGINGGMFKFFHS
jgi:hypothetical protein